MSVEEIRKLIEVSEQSQYKFDFILTGGEPLLWSNLHEGVRLLRLSSITNSIRVFSNVTHINQVTDEFMSDIDQLRISQYPTNLENTKLLKKRYASKVKVVDRGQFYPNPEQPLDDVLPAVCCNPEVMYFNGDVYGCPHSLSIALHHSKTSELTLSEPLRPGFLEAMPAIREGQEKDICTCCISNKNVRDKIALAVNEAPFRARRGAGEEPSA
ncbi:MAG: radical SAM protein [Candidatus Obscuribacterales bacterium]|nr:radical SAM protein [Candidatus Obscuribacterales bacterium]